MQYRYAQPIDYILIACGTLLALGQGILNSISSVIFKQLTDSFAFAQRNIINNSAFTTILHEGSLLTDIQLNEFNSDAIGAINAYVGCGIGLLFVAFAAVNLKKKKFFTLFIILHLIIEMFFLFNPLLIFFKIALFDWLLTVFFSTVTNMYRVNE